MTAFKVVRHGLNSDSLVVLPFSIGGRMRMEMPANRPLGLGDHAPEVALDAIAHDGKIALRDCQGRSPILIGLFRGLHCPFCRRHIAAMSRVHGALCERGIESIAVVNTPVERARLYFRFHPLP